MKRPAISAMFIVALAAIAAWLVFTPEPGRHCNYSDSLARPEPGHDEALACGKGSHRAGCSGLLVLLAQADMPGRSEAIRRLVEIGLKPKK